VRFVQACASVVGKRLTFDVLTGRHLFETR